jgi:hypothetical protein
LRKDLKFLCDLLLLNNIYIPFCGNSKIFFASLSKRTDKHANRLINDRAEMIFIGNSNYVKHSRLIAIGTSLSENSSEFKQMRKKLLSLDKTLTSLLQNNKWYKN